MVRPAKKQIDMLHGLSNLRHRKNIIEAIIIDTIDPAFSGGMIVEITLTVEEAGRKVAILFNNIPLGIHSEENETGKQ